MKKIVSLLIFTLLLSIACSSPQEPEDNTKKITLAERKGTYEGEYVSQKITINFDDKGSVINISSILGMTFGTPVKVGNPTSTDTKYTFEVEVTSKAGTEIAEVTVVFDSATESTGATVDVRINGVEIVKQMKVTKVA